MDHHRYHKRDDDRDDRHSNHHRSRKHRGSESRSSSRKVNGYRHKRQRDSRSSSSSSSSRTSSRSRSSSHSGHKRRHHKDHNKHHRDHYRSNKRRKDKDEIPTWDDEERHLKIQLGSNITSRYKILSLMGEGTFGKVVECWDRDSKKYLAVKIIRAIEKYTDAAMIEMDVLETIKKNDPKHQQPCIQMQSWFTYKDHVCMVFEKYGPSLFDFMKKNKFRPFLLKHIQQFGIQLLAGVSFMHSLLLVHTDLKPENILLVSGDYEVKMIEGSHEYRIPKSSAITLIDFGSATFEHQHHTAVVSTRHYRAPEVILGLGWTYPCDIFSVGCILAELFVGDAIFITHENHEHLALFENTFGPIPQDMIRRADKSSRKYFEDDKLIWPGDHSTSSQKHVKEQQSLREMIVLNPENKTQLIFYDLLTQLLQYDPERRPTAKVALAHEFFTLNIPDDEIHAEQQNNNDKQSNEK